MSGRHGFGGPHYYKGLDDNDDHNMKVSISMRELAEKICSVNYGVHRLLSHIIDVRREKLAEIVARYRERGDDDVAHYAETKGDRLADAIEAALRSGES